MGMEIIVQKFKWDDSLPKPAKPRQNDGKGNTVYDAG